MNAKIQSSVETILSFVEATLIQSGRGFLSGLRTVVQLVTIAAFTIVLSIYAQELLEAYKKCEPTPCVSSDPILIERGGPQ